MSVRIADRQPAAVLDLVAVSIAKAGESLEHCEDAHSASLDLGLFAVSDGASSSFDARRWSQHLALNWTRDPIDSWSTDSMVEWFARVIRRWAANEVSETGAEVNWWDEAGAERGAYATLVGLWVSNSPDGATWSSVAIGDSCMLHLRDGCLVASFPMQRGDAFGSYPDLVGSQMEPTRLPGLLQWAHGTALRGDQLVLATDAVAEWALSADANCEALFRLPAGQLEQSLVAARSAGNIVNDDLTVLRVLVAGAAADRATAAGALR